MKRILIAILLLAVWGGAPAIDSSVAFSDPALQARYERLTNQTRCLVCQNQTIADSNASLAADLRVQIKEMIQAGKSDQQILDFLTARYGDFVLYKPPVAPRTWLLWGGPFLFLIVGIMVAVAVIVRKSRLVTDDEAVEIEQP